MRVRLVRGPVNARSSRPAPTIPSAGRWMARDTAMAARIRHALQAGLSA